MSSYWSTESWGAEYPPENAQEITEAVNGLLANLVSDYHREIVSARLWEQFCETGSVLGITATP